MDNKIKNVIFLSNYFNHHQKPFSDAMFQRLKDGYKFIETEPMDYERRNMGWEIKDYPSYVISSDELNNSYDKYIKMINDADIVIEGSAPYKMISERLKSKKLTFIYTERIYKKGYQAYKFPVRLINFWRKYGQYKNLYLLCASAYTAADFAKTFTFLNKSYKWGYFPEFKKYDDIDNLISKKISNSILWCARMIDWKHPETAIEIAKRLKSDGYDFTLNLIGNGILKDKIQMLIESENLNDNVHMLGTMKPEQVRKYMEKSEVFLFTSDRNEGWGAVLNESMNSACAVIANHAIGSVPFLIDNKKNGLIYKNTNIDDLYAKMKWLLDNPDERKLIAKKAYNTIKDEWNADNAAEKLILLTNFLGDCKHMPNVLNNGVCSKAKILRDDWFEII